MTLVRNQNPNYQW